MSCQAAERMLDRVVERLQFGIALMDPSNAVAIVGRDETVRVVPVAVAVAALELLGCAAAAAIVRVPRAGVLRIVILDGDAAYVAEIFMQRSARGSA